MRPGARIADNAADLVKGSDEDGDRRMSGQDMDNDVSVGKLRKPRRWGRALYLLNLRKLNLHNIWKAILLKLKPMTRK